MNKAMLLSLLLLLSYPLAFPNQVEAKKQGLQPTKDLNLFNLLPTGNVNLEGASLWQLPKEVNLMIRATRFFTAQIAAIAASSMATPPQDFSGLVEPRQRGKFTTSHEKLLITDGDRQRRFYVLLYQPEVEPGSSIPVLIFSHGLGAAPEDFAEIADHLASYGYVVALPQHIGSDRTKTSAANSKDINKIFDYQEFRERPEDIRVVIDELERLNQEKFFGKLDLENVGVAGHSLGGYTALAVAGAEINFDYLREVCNHPLPGINISLFVQCQALNLPEDNYQFRDERVKAIFIKNPLGSAVFSKEGLEKITIPVMILGGNLDHLTPFVFEQLKPFTWLATPDKYLGLAEGQSHTKIPWDELGISELIISLLQLNIVEDSKLDTVYVNPMAIAFFGLHLLGQEEFRPLLTSDYGQHLSEEQLFKFYLL
jgi:predicted dienelactone hydrolase